MCQVVLLNLTGNSVGDGLWAEGVSFQAAVDFFPAPLVALRSLKSDPIVGLPEGAYDRLAAIDPQWHFNGKRGLLQSNLVDGVASS